MNENQINEVQKEEEPKKKPGFIQRFKTDKVFRRWVIIVAVILFMLSPMGIRIYLNIGGWYEVNDSSSGKTWASEGKTRFYPNGVWAEVYSDGSGSDGEWELLSDYTLIFDNGYDVYCYDFGEWFCVGTHLFLGDDYQFTRLPFLYARD